MSAHHVVYVRCDYCTANDSADMADEGATLSEQREELHERGWTTPHRGVDLCTDCSKWTP